MRTIVLAILAVAVFTNARSQKLPNKQQASLKAPANVKIDGKATEWGEFKAYNSATEVFYTIANDDKNLYLVVHATDPLVTRKIIAGGITFSVGTENSGNKETVSATYPLYDRKNPPNFNVSNKTAFSTSSAKADSFMIASNKEIVKKFRQIVVKGCNVPNDTLSVYNEEGILVSAQFNNRLAYSYELALPLKYLNIKAGKVSLLNYSIVLNGSAYAEASFFEHIVGGMRVSSPVVRGKDLPSIKDMQIISASTDMNGTYTLAQ